jgi:uncharacterized caspase-like protein
MMSSSAVARSSPPRAGASKSDLYPKSYAIVIGVNEPQGDWAPLMSAHEDAQMFADHLEKRGFKVTLLLGDDATKREVLRQLQTQLPQKVGADDRFIFYFAGHGQTQTLGRGKKLGYIVPADGTQSAGQDEWHTYLSMRELRSLLTEHILSKHTLLIFDSCFSGLMFARGGLRRPNLGAKSYLKRRGVMAITAGGEGELALDGLFTPTLIQALSGEADENEDGITSFQEIALYTQREVNVRQDEQNPQFGVISGIGQMIFRSQRQSLVPDVEPDSAQIQDQTPSTAKATTTQAMIVSDRDDQGVSKNLISQRQATSSPQSRILWQTIAITSGIISLAGMGTIWHAQARYQDMLNESDPQIFNQRVQTEAQDTIDTNNMGVVTLALGGSALIFSVYKLLTTPASSPSMSSSYLKSESKPSSVSIKPAFAPRFTGFEITW